MAKMTKEVMDLFNDPRASKVLATLDREGNPSVVPIGSLSALDEETIAFGEIFIGKTKENLEATKKAAALAFKLPPVGYEIKGTLQGFQASGAVFDNFARQIKESIKLDIKSVGLIKVDEVYSVTPGKSGKIA